MVIGTLFVPVHLLRIMKIVSVLFFCLFIIPISAQSTYFLDLLWDANGITLQNSEKVKVAVKQNRRFYISSQNIYFEITQNGKQVFWSSLPHPRHVHVEYADESGSLHRQDSILVAENSHKYTVRGTDLTPGSHYLTAVVTDTTTMIRTDPRATRISTVPWKLNVGKNLSVDDNITVPDQIHLYPNYPNPFNPATTISYKLPETMAVKISVINMNGRVVDTIINEIKPQGDYSVIWDANRMSSGIYYFKLETPAGIKIRQGILIK